MNFVFPFYGFVGIQEEAFRIGAGSMKWVGSESESDKTCDHGRILMPPIPEVQLFKEVDNE